jgi:hypothetical protein
MMVEVKITYIWMKITGRILISLWAGFWMFFAIASSIGEKMFADVIVIGVIILVPTIIAWWKEHIGGWMLFIISIVILIGYPIVMSQRIPIGTRLLTDLMLSFCPLVAGLLFIIRYRKLKEENI